MKVWVIVPNYDDEGYGSCRAAYTTRELAEEAMRKLERDRVWDVYKIFELDLDPPQ